ncbi:hypothetical protein BpHYR1_047133 [Brachionus plicatilis]|uniref:Uncharacterized protein n=1 Tax=Brachionus plicatilis TaxID=10195 RepID=A0A3M7RNM3_BRAPC|nr:hypothetical protein BpHYR1_047133 [Brachionus plicatilis]
MIRTNIAKLLLLSQALSILLGINGFVLKYDNHREKRDMLSLLRGSDALVSANDVNPLDVIPIPLRLGLTGDQKRFFQEEDDQEEEDNEQEDIHDQLSTPGADISADNFEQKLNDLKLMYETAISNLRTETIGAQTYIQKKTSLAEQHLENILKSVELMVNNRVDLSFHSIETKMNEAQKLLNALNVLILKNLESKLKSMEGDLFSQVRQEKTELENKMNLFSEKVEMLSEKLTELVSGRVNAIKSKDQNETNTTSETTAVPVTTTVPLTTNSSLNESLEVENISVEDVLNDQTESENEPEETEENFESDDQDQDALETTQVSEEAPVENEVVLNAWRPSVYNFEDSEYEEYSVPNSELMVDYYQGSHPIHYEYNVDYHHY